MKPETTLEQIKEVWKHWQGDRHRMRSSVAMVKVSTILEDAEKEA